VPPLRPVAIDGEGVVGVTTLDELRDAARCANIIVEPDIRVRGDGGGPSRGWGWWHPRHRPWHYAPEGHRRWSEREAMEDCLRATKDDRSDSNQHHQGGAPKMAKKKRKAKVAKAVTVSVSMSRHRKALAEILALKAKVAAIYQLMEKKQAEPKPGHAWVQMPIKTEGTTSVETPTA
jgi:hypothetical protein